MTTYEMFMNTNKQIEQYIEQQQQEEIMKLVEMYLEDEMQK